MIIESLLDNDLYKLSMAQTVLHQYPGARVEYTFKSRNHESFTPKMYEEVVSEIHHLCSLQFNEKELDYLRTIRYFKKDFIDFLSLIKLNKDHIQILHTTGNEIYVKISGSWILTILYEVPVLAIINEVYFRNMVPNPDYAEAQKRLEDKIKIAHNEGFKFSDFGTRRRFSKDWQDTVVNNLAIRRDIMGLTGTSNVLFAMKHNLTPIGTMAHEFIMAHQQLGPRLIDSQKAALQSWVDEYRGDLGIALTDTIGIDAFLKDFDLYFAKLYDGLRHDSGDPIAWGEKCIKHYESLKINPMTKTLVFSDGLDFEKATVINNHFKNRINVAFGIGTNLTNDFPGVKPLNIVIKMTRCNERPVAKISDAPTKGMCEDEGFVEYLKDVFNVNKNL